MSLAIPGHSSFMTHLSWIHASDPARGRSPKANRNNWADLSLPYAFSRNQKLLRGGFALCDISVPEIGKQYYSRLRCLMCAATIGRMCGKPSTFS
jgi:hypothetical protein